MIERTSNERKKEKANKTSVITGKAQIAQILKTDGS